MRNTDIDFKGFGDSLELYKHAKREYTYLSNTQSVIRDFMPFSAYLEIAESANTNIADSCDYIGDFDNLIEETALYYANSIKDLCDYIATYTGANTTSAKCCLKLIDSLPNKVLKLMPYLGEYAPEYREHRLRVGEYQPVELYLFDGESEGEYRSDIYEILDYAKEYA